jgi:chitodextrinase
MEGNAMAASTYSARTPGEYIETRVDYKTEAYRKKGERYRWSYLITASVAAIAAAAKTPNMACD